MKKREELYKTTEYWLENIQNDIFKNVHEYMDTNNLSKADLAKELGFSRSYITQILNGEFNFSIKKLIELSLAIGRAPIVEYELLEDAIDRKEKELEFFTNGLKVSYNVNNVNLGGVKMEELIQDLG